MICATDVGPGQNITFYLITTGLDVNPKNGTVAESNYEYLKRIITEKSELLYEEPNLRYSLSKDVTDYLTAYNSVPRSVYQLLFGVAAYSDAWDSETLAAEINSKSFYNIKRPNDGDFSINPYELYDKGFGLYKCQEISPGTLAWVNMSEFKITEKMPGFNDGYDNSVWGVLQNSKMEIFIKNAFLWTSLEDYVQLKGGTLTVSKAEPSLVDGDFWFKTDDIKIYQYDNYAWGPGLTTYFSPTLSGSWNNGDKILVYKKSALSLFEYAGGKYTKKNISQYVIRDAQLNSSFLKDVSNNFLLESCNGALTGGVASPLFDGGSSKMKVYQDGVLKGEFLGLDFYGPDITANGDKALIEFSALATGNSIVDTATYPVTVNGQLVFHAPSNSLAMVDVSVNGVDEDSFTFDDTAKTFTFNPTQAGYDLETTDQVILTYLKPAV